MSHGSALVEQLAEVLDRDGLTVAVAESLTSGNLAAALGAGPNAAGWFRGGVVAYAAEVKYDLLGVTPGPVVTAACAEQMARGVAHLLDATASVAATGVGGPEPEEGHPPGTVYVAVSVRDTVRSRRLELAGDPDQVLAQTAECALSDLLALVRAR